MRVYLLPREKSAASSSKENPSINEHMLRRRKLKVVFLKKGSVKSRRKATFNPIDRGAITILLKSGCTDGLAFTSSMMDSVKATRVKVHICCIVKTTRLEVLEYFEPLMVKMQLMTLWLFAMYIR